MPFQWYRPMGILKGQKHLKLRTQDAVLFTRARRPVSLRTGRCVNCSCLKRAHAEDGACPDEGGMYATKNLPRGKTCANCAHVQVCCLILNQLPEDQTCQFEPVRFYPIAAMERR
jgi:hypothetical protein